MESTAVAVVPPSDAEIQGIRAKGRALALHKKETQELFRTLEGMEWGAGGAVVKGSHFSPQTRYALAQFCQITRANPLTQVDILGGKPYLNANYWKDRVVNDPMYVDLAQRDITETSEASLREMAAARRTEAAALAGTDDVTAARMRARALDLEEEADDIARSRVHYGVPAWATDAVETVIRRFLNSAPMDEIKAGRLPMDEAEKWIIEVRECNWAGGKPRETKRRKDGSGTYDYDPDPVGNAEPAKTARTRSLRRCATAAFSAWMAPFEEQIRKAEEAIEAEWELVQEEVQPPMRAIGTGNGEPTAAPEATARALPVRGEPVQEQAPEPAPEPTPPAFDAEDARKRFFATLRDCLGISNNDGRKAWMVANNLGDSIKPWKQADYDKAQELLVGPIRDDVYRLCGAQGVVLADLALSVIGKESAEWGSDWVKLRDALVKGEDEDGEL